MIYNDSWNDSPIELLSDTTIAQPNLVGEQLGASTSIVGDDIFFVSGSLQSEQQRQHHSSSVSLSKTYSKMPAFTFSDGEQRSLTSVVKNKSITNVPSSSSINVRSSQTISDDLFWGEDDDEWTRLAVQATENAERALVNKPASSSALAPPRAGVLPTKYASSFSSVNNVPSMISEQDDPEDPLDPLWEEIGKYAYHAFKNHTLKNEPPRPIITPSYPLSHRVVPATTPTTEENKFKTYSLKYWLDTHVIVIDDEDMKS
ncbi:hypothetical protein BDA99DRAFT_293985 [Phascolomyces articulosus]|uniref:Uncharacterized protein n=1 Tax=Phascolomyces articulosus TaxID=60185 RepID=A0AAD5P7I6_9FUNG|nr:hypothetical protein BDA99DRAFT_293985 [Phascolomyces articulosus]